MKNNNVQNDVVQTQLIKYIKIVAFSLFLPLWIVAMINEGAVIAKIFSWYKTDIEFWTIKKYYLTTIVIALIPIVYLIWFYHLTIKKALANLHHDFIQDFNFDIGKTIATSLIKWKGEGIDIKNKTDLPVGVFLNYLNEKLDGFPRPIQWLARKLFDQMPVFDLVNTYNLNDLNENSKTDIAERIAEKFNAYELEIIDSLVPGWTKFVIPLNLILLFFYFKL